VKVEDLVAATGGTLCSGDRDTIVGEVGTDTRNLERGSVFVALSGESYDANDFLAEAVGAGAVAIVCQRGRAIERDGVACVEVDDTERALGDIAHRHRETFDIPFIAVTGSNGKTTTKEMIRSILGAAYGGDAVLATEGNFNNLVGLPLTLLKLTAAHEVGVVEMGMNAPGEIARLAEIAVPDVGVITCVGAAHLEGLGSLEGVARAKGELYEALADNAVAVINADDPWVVRQAPRFAGHTRWFGDAGDLKATDVVMVSMGVTRFRLSGDGLDHTVEMPLGGRHNVSNALAAAAATRAIGVSPEKIVDGLAQMVPPPMRLAYEKLANGVELVDDCYNANPSSVAAAFQTMAETAGERRIVVLGDMLELGADAAMLHVRAGHAAALLGPILLCVLGEFSGELADGAREGGMEEGIVIASSHDEAAAAVARVWRAGDGVLVKGSRGAAMEKVVDALKGLATK
jgi:UDP-N-acetylmuramoyl-tripeptide--D-alanyl-D-alanine ligase